MIEFKIKIDQNRFVLPPVESTAAQRVTYEAVPEDIKIAVSDHFRSTIAEMTFDHVSTILITARLKSELRTEILKKIIISL